MENSILFEMGNDINLDFEFRRMVKWKNTDLKVRVASI
jgi:hypothetical protein